MCHKRIAGSNVKVGLFVFILRQLVVGFFFFKLSSNFTFDLLPWLRMLRSAVVPHIRNRFNYEVFEGSPLGSVAIQRLALAAKPRVCSSNAVIFLSVSNTHFFALANRGEVLINIGVLFPPVVQGVPASQWREGG